MRRLGFRWFATVALVIATLVPFAPLVARAQQKLDPADPALPQAWIALGHRLNGDKVKPGQTVVGLTIDSFTFHNCAILRGVVLRGKVIAVRPWDNATHQTSVDLLFSATCLDGTRLPLTLISAYEPIPAGGRQTEIIESLPVNINPSYSSHMDPGMPNRPPSNDESFPTPSARPGEVHRITHLTLLVEQGEQGSTQLASDRQQLRLEEGTRLGLVPAALPSK